MTFNTKDNDSWETPPEEFARLAQYIDIPAGAVVWDPFYSTGRAQSGLQAAFPQASVIHRKRDFFTTNQAADFIVTNPPFSIIRQVWNELMDRDIPFAMLMQSDKLFPRYGQEMLVRGGQDVTVLWPETRIQYIDPATGEQTKGSRFFSVWLLYKMPLSDLARGITPLRTIMMSAAP